MVQSYLNTGTQAGNFEDLVNFITKISYEKTPFLSKSGRAKAKAIKHEWMTQALKAGGANAKAEGADTSFAAANITARVRRDNQCQIFSLPFSVSETQDSIDKAGLGQSPEYENQKELKFKELALDIDFELLQNTKVVRDADAGTAGELDGLINWAGSTRSGSNGVLTQDIYNALTQTLAENGSDPDIVICAGFQRRMISSWTTPFKTHETGKTTLSDTVEIYKGDFGQQMVLFDKHMPTDKIAVYESKYLKVAYLRPASHYQLGRTGDLTKGYVLSELTLEVLNPNAVGTITSLATA